MIDKAPPPQPAIEQPAQAAVRKEAPIVDMRKQFERKTPQTAEDRARTRAFIDGKIEMVRLDPNLTDAEKAAEISNLEAKR
jgi:hypothetical protein